LSGRPRCVQNKRACLAAFSWVPRVMLAVAKEGMVPGEVIQT
jgi:hypothetical protein